MTVAAWGEILVGGFLWRRFPPGDVLGCWAMDWRKVRAGWPAGAGGGPDRLGGLGHGMCCGAAGAGGVLVGLRIPTTVDCPHRAPDLALTQILVETVSLVLIVTLLARFPRSAQEGEELDRPWTFRRGVTVAVAIGFGMMMTAMGLLVTARPHSERIGGWYLKTSVGRRIEGRTRSWSISGGSTRLARSQS